MFAGISVTCFVASYTLAWLLELGRVALGRRAPVVLVLIAGAAGLTAHTLFLWHRAVSADRSPLSSWYDWYLVAAWVLALLYLYLAAVYPRNTLGVFVLPGVLLLVGVAMATASQQPFPEPEAAHLWGWLHGGLLAVGSVVALCGFVFGLLYLWQARRLRRHRLAPSGIRLPSLEWLEATNERTLIACVLLLGLGFLAGVISNLVNHTLVSWTDPVVWSSALLCGWMVIVAVFQAVYRPARVGRKVAYLAVASFLLLLLTLAVIKLVDPSHGGTVQHRRTNPSSTAAERGLEKGLEKGTGPFSPPRSDETAENGPVPFLRICGGAA
jgi:ABC-type uncharacterized transport system permease subunit